MKKSTKVTTTATKFISKEEKKNIDKISLLNSNETKKKYSTLTRINCIEPTVEKNWCKRESPIAIQILGK